MNIKDNKGFTLTELAVVVVIIGLLVSIVSFGFSMREKAKSQALLSEISYYLASISQFKDKYKYKPGDLPEADHFFTGAAVDLSEEATNRGNDSWDSPSERNILWPQMFQAGIISANITVNTDPKIPGINTPGSRVENIGWTVLDTMSVVMTGPPATFIFNEVLRFGGADNVGETLSAAIVPLETHRYIDSKMDTPNTPLSGAYVVGEPACVRFITAEYKYVVDSEADDIRCTGNIVDVN